MTPQSSHTSPRERPSSGLLGLIAELSEQHSLLSLPWEKLQGRGKRPQSNGTGSKLAIHRIHSKHTAVTPGASLKQPFCLSAKTA
ncbi:unnamed protein product [Arctogadus glacialis]